MIERSKILFLDRFIHTLHHMAYNNFEKKNMPLGENVYQNIDSEREHLFNMNIVPLLIT